MYSVLGVSATAETKLSLSEAIALSLDHSYSVKSYRHDSIAAEYDYRAARSHRFPTLNLNATSFYIDEIQSAEFPFGQSLELGVKDNYQADVRLLMPLFTGGRISSRMKINQESILAKSFSLETEELETAFNCRKVYLTVMLSQAVASAAEASLNRIRIIRQDIEHLHFQGLADSIDILEAELAYQKAVLMRAEKEAAVRNATSALVQTLGMPGNEVVLPEETIPIPDDRYRKMTIPPDEINRPELKVIDSKIRSADILARFNRADYFPGLNAFVGYSVGRPNRDFLDNEWNDYFTAGLTLDWKLNLGRKTIYRIRSTRESAFSARMSRKKLEESLTLTAEIALENLNLAYRTFITSEKEYKIAEQKYHLGKEKQKAGLLTVNRLLEMEAELTASEELFKASMINYYISESEYLYATGSRRIYGGL